MVSETKAVSPRTGTAILSLEGNLGENSKIMLWDGTRPLCPAVYGDEIEMISDELMAIIPAYDEVVSDIRQANSYWQGRITPEFDDSYWDSAAYHTGNMEAYKLLGDESFLNYSLRWAEANNWVGSGSNDYDSDNQTCFQTFIDLYNISPSYEKIAEVMRVIDSQIETSSDSYWSWCDALYMSMPVFTKLYKLTGNEKYLDAMYKYFRFAKELMYDGEGGIPTGPNGYTTSAWLNYGAEWADVYTYKGLFYRDSNYVYPLNNIDGIKNFWSRGNGWAFAALAKVLADLPESYPHYDEFLKTYREMAMALVDCQHIDENGNGYWTESLLANYPLSPDYNPLGYETSGTAFFTYGFLWGINNGFLDEGVYLETALRGWKYLSEEALQPNGLVGYVQDIGAAAQSYAPHNTDSRNFGVGAFLLAGCEMARYSMGSGVY